MGKVVLQVNTPHTGLLRLGLAVAQSATFWRKASDDLPLKELQNLALSQDWFNVSEARTKYLVGQLQKRFPFPVRQALKFGRDLERRQCQLVCHWHLQLTDPVYRRFTSEYLLSRWTSPTTTIDLEGSEKWVKSLPMTCDWKSVTARRMASGLLSAATDAGLCSGSGKGERSLRLPTVSDADIEYLKTILKAAGALAELDLYLNSVGCSQEEKV